MPHHSTPRKLTLYTKSDCPLCDEADHLIQRCIKGYDVAYTHVDIMQDPRLQQAYGQSIPVLAVDGEPVFFGKVSEYRLKKILSGEGISERYRAFLRRFTSRF